MKRLTSCHHDIQINNSEFPDIESRRFPSAFRSRVFPVDRQDNRPERFSAWEFQVVCVCFPVNHKLWRNASNDSLIDGLDLSAINNVDGTS